MDFIDFQIRIWQIDDHHAQILVHSSPAGGMRKPMTVPLDLNQLSKLLPLNHEPLATLRELGTQLAQIIFPPPVFTFLVRSLERIHTEDGLRIRLCLDEALIDLPWEFLYCPDMSEFLVLNGRVSLVREAPTVYQQVRISKRTQRMVFINGLWEGYIVDQWQVDRERRLLTDALKSVQDLLEIDHTAAENEIERMLMKPAAIFHYAGRTDTDPDGGGGYICSNPSGSSSQKFYSSTLSKLLCKAHTQLAVFTGDYSGSWPFVKPLIKSEIPPVPVVIGVHGRISTTAAIAFCHKLYASLVIGMSLDEAVTWARLHILENNESPQNDNGEWGKFMVYMPATEAVLFPKPQNRDVRERQKAARNARQQTIINVIHNIGSVQEGAQVTGVQIGQITSVA